MSRFFSSRYASLVPYVPGEQPKNMQYVKLNTNESPFPPSPMALKAAGEAAASCQLYSDPDCTEAVAALAELYGLEKDEILFTNGSDEILNFAFMAFCDETHPAVFADITYGFYSVFAQVNRLPSTIVPLREDFSLCVEDYMKVPGTVFIANPNAPTALAVPLSEIERLVAADPDRIVVVDEAYVDFGGESAVPLIHKYSNLLVTQTFSKSRSLAGARLGFGIGCRELIRDLNTLKYSTNPYNVNRITMAAGAAALRDEAYTRQNCRTIMENRSYTAEKLRDLGFTLTDSRTNFLFAAHPAISGEKLYQELKNKGVLVRHFTAPRISEYNRITVGTREQMDFLLKCIREILEENV